MRKALWCSLVVVALVAAANVCPAQQEGSAATGGTKPLVTVAFAGYDELLADVDFIGKLAGNPGLAEMAKAMVIMGTGGQGLVGLDTKRPWGVLVQTDGQQFPVVAFLPVTDLKKLLGLLEKQGIQAKDNGGTLEIATPARPVYAKDKGEWAILADSPASLAGAPADPLKLLGDLPKKYLLAVRASVKNVPPMFRQIVTAQLTMGAREGMKQLPGEGDEEYAIRTNLANQAIQQITAMINDLDEIQAGLAIDRTGGATYLDIEVTAVPGTKTALQFGQMKAAASNFAGFTLPGAAVTANWARTLSDADVVQAKSAVSALGDRAKKELKNQGLPPDRAKLAGQLLKDLLEVVQQTIETKKTDGAVAIQLEPGAAGLVAGTAIVGGAKLDKIVKQLVAEVAKEDAEVAKLITLDAETYEGVRFHTLSVPIPDENAAKALGKTLNVVLGIGDESLYVAAGGAASKTLKQAIDKSKAAAGKEVMPIRVSLAGAPIARFIAAMGDGPEKDVAAKMAETLEQSQGKDHITLTSEAIPNGSKTRLEVEEGVLKALGSLSQGMGAAGDRPAAAKRSGRAKPAKTPAKDDF